jgi:hypothetical protein
MSTPHSHRDPFFKDRKIPVPKSISSKVVVSLETVQADSEKPGFDVDKPGRHTVVFL